MKRQRREAVRNGNPIVSREKDKHKVLAKRRNPYRVRRAPAYDTRPIVKRELPRAVERIVNALHPEKIILFGSFARGKPTPDSDVDLMVIMETTATHNERYLAVARQLRPRVFPVDIIVKTPDEVEGDLKSGDFFVKEIVTQGRVLYERDH